MLRGICLATNTETKIMKKYVLGMLVILFVLNSCSLFRGGEKYGCPTNGKNIGAEKIASGDQKAMKQAQKAKKYKVRKF